MNGDVQSDLATLAFNNGEHREYFHGRILRLQQEIMFHGENLSPNIFLLQYTNTLPRSDKLRDFIATMMKYLITFLDNNGKYAVYTLGDIYGIYCYLDMIGAPKILTTSGQRYNHFSPSSSTKNDTTTLQPFIAALRTRQ